MVTNRLLRALALSVTLASGLAQELKVDINNTARQYTEGTDPAFTPWSTDYAWFAGGDVTSATFNGITIKFTRTGNIGTGLQPGYWKDGILNAAYTTKLAGDGIKVNGGDLGGQIEMRISGLAQGSHTLLTYHNVWDNISSNAARLNIYVGGVQAVTNLPMSIRVTNTAAAATAYLTLQAKAGQDLVVVFEANRAIAAANTNVYLNGFEIDTVNSRLKAVNPSPRDRDEHVDADQKSLWLSWAAAGSAVSHDVYFGSDSNAVKAATRASPLFQGNQAAIGYLAANINSMLTYYWRVDEVSGAGEVTKGDIWMFRPRHLAFPGAEGYGRFARGGRGGVVVEVTNLNDSGAGSFRQAIEGDYGPRTIVFTVSGLITLESDLIISGSMPPMTIAGQTAPGKGICLRKHQFGMSGATDVICRFIRSRPGDISGETQNGSGMAGVDHAIMDHCSISWGIDEEISTRGARNFTLQKVLIAEALNVAGHDKYPPGTAHGYAASVGGDIGSLHHNLLAHCDGRNWSLAGGLDGAGYFAGRLDIFNNVVYNWRGRTTDGGAHQVNFVNNYYQPGPAIVRTKILTAEYESFPGTQQYYFVGNVMPGYYQTNQQETARTYTGVPNGYSPWVATPFFPSHASIDEVTNAFKSVLSDVGCNLPQIDAHDLRVIHETINGTFSFYGSVSGLPGLPDSQQDVGGWEPYPTLTRPPGWDSDHDGLPDWWETIKGLKPSSPAQDFSDSNRDPDGDEYTNLEDYLNWLAEPHAECSAGESIDIDLPALTRGFTNDSPAYTILTQTNGTVSLNFDGRTARFAPTVTTNALGGFSFRVVDAHGYHMTRNVNVRIMGTAPAPRPRLRIRKQDGNLALELTGPADASVTLESKTDWDAPWSALTNLTATGSLQLLPLTSSDESPRFFRAFTPGP